MQATIQLTSITTISDGSFETIGLSTLADNDAVHQEGENGVANAAFEHED